MKTKCICMFLLPELTLSLDRTAESGTKTLTSSWFCSFWGVLTPEEHIRFPRCDSSRCFGGLFGCRGERFLRSKWFSLFCGPEITKSASEGFKCQKTGSCLFVWPTAGPQRERGLDKERRRRKEGDGGLRAGRKGRRSRGEEESLTEE